jgi:hypothetical protein
MSISEFGVSEKMMDAGGQTSNQFFVSKANNKAKMKRKSLSRLKIFLFCMSQTKVFSSVARITFVWG